jgi:hypothetical protein
MKVLCIVVCAALVFTLGACSIKEEKTTQAASSASAPAAPADTTKSTTYSLF